jgi:hypothetical protein
MTPEELMRAGLDPRAYYPDYDIAARARAGLVPAEVLTQRGATTITPKVSVQQQAKQRAQELANKTLAGAQDVMGSLGALPFGRLGLAAGVIPGVTTAATELAAGRPVGAGGALGGAAIGGVTAAGIARLLPTTGRFGIVGKAARLGLPFLGAGAGAQLGAEGAEYARQQVTNVPTKGKEGEFASQLAAERALSDLELSQFRTKTGIETSLVKDLSKFASDQAYLDLQRNIPLVNQMKNADLVRQQALLASQGNQQARLNILQTAGNLAMGAQGQTGETLRTMITSNPYANAVLR